MTISMALATKGNMLQYMFLEFEMPGLKFSLRLNGS